MHEFYMNMIAMIVLGIITSLSMNLFKLSRSSRIIALGLSFIMAMIIRIELTSFFQMLWGFFFFEISYAIFKREYKVDLNHDIHVQEKKK